MRKHVKKRHKDIRVAELSNGKSSQTCCLHPFRLLEMEHCNWIVIKNNSVYLNLRFLSIYRSLKKAISVSHCKKTDNSINHFPHPHTNQFLGQPILFWDVFSHLIVVNGTSCSMNTKNYKHPAKLAFWWQSWKAEAFGLLMKSRQASGKEKSANNGKGEQKHEKIREHLYLF